MKKRIEQELNPALDDPIDELEIFDIVKGIKDPEH